MNKIILISLLFLNNFIFNVKSAANSTFANTNAEDDRSNEWKNIVQQLQAEQEAQRSQMLEETRRRIAIRDALQQLLQERRRSPRIRIIQDPITGNFEIALTRDYTINPTISEWDAVYGRPNDTINPIIHR